MGALCSCCLRPRPPPANEPEPPLGSPTFLLAASSPVPASPMLGGEGHAGGDSSNTPTPTPTSTRRPPRLGTSPLATGAGPLLLRLSLPWSTRSRASHPRASSSASSPASPPCIRTSHLSWTAPANLTDPHSLGDHRDAFWDTAPTYGGRSEIWMALRMAVDAVRDGDVELAKVIADAAQLALPTSGDITCDPAYDPLGNAYTVPVYCLVDPSNLGAVPAASAAIVSPVSIGSSQDTVATSPSAPLSDAARPVTLAPTSASSDESLACTDPIPGASKHGPPPPFPTDAPAPSSSSSILKSTQTCSPATAHRPLDLTVRLSSGPSISLPTAHNNWTVSDAISTIMGLRQSEPFRPKAMMYLGRLLPPSLKLGDVQWVTPEGPFVLQLLVVPTGGDKPEVGQGRDQEEEEGAKTPVAGRRKS